MANRYEWTVSNCMKGDIWPAGQQPKGVANSVEEAYRAAEEACPDFVGSTAWHVDVYKWVGVELEWVDRADFNFILNEL